MCGIAGIVGPKSSAAARSDAPRWMQGMLTAMRYRGPDDAAIFADDQATLGHVRLAIRDLSPAGAQPMCSPCGRFVLVYNGEIYNAADLRRDLMATGRVRLRGHCDTELLLHAYLLWGEDCLDRIAGMFSFAVWDARERTLFAARDRLGIKPLFYHIHDRTLAFASEVKSLLALPWIQADLNPRALMQFLHLRYNDLPESIFRGVFKLMPGECLTWRDGEAHHRRYWRLEVPRRYADRSRAEWVDATRTRLEQCVDEHFISDVPVGVFLSGGIDSNTIAAIATHVGNRRLKTFSVGFSTEKGEDEIDKINVSASHLGSEHHELILRPDIEDVWPKVIFACDELMADPATVPTYLLSDMASQHVKVVLSGEGGDELFGGYERSMMLLYARRYLARLPLAARRAMVAMLRGAPSWMLDRVFKYTRRLGARGFDRLRGFLLSVENPLEAFSFANSVFTPAELRDLVSPELAAEARFEAAWKEQIAHFFETSSTRTFLNDELRYETETRLWADLLAKLDGATMPFSLEGRVPYLDHRLVEFAATIPPEHKIRGLHNKIVLREAARKYLPQGIRRRKKDHFYVPIDKWLVGRLRPFLDSLLDPKSLERQGLFRASSVRRLLDEYDQGAIVHGRQLWNLVSFQIWYQIYIEKTLSPSCGRQATHQPIRMLHAPTAA